MALPTFPPSHPLGTINPVTFRAAAILLAAGAWDVAPLEISVAGFRWLTLFLTYTRGAAGGAVDFQAESSPNSADTVLEDWFTQTLYAPGVMAAGTDIVSRVQRELITYLATGAAAENFVFGPIEIGGAVERMRVRARESGDVANPGNIAIYGVLYT